MIGAGDLGAFVEPEPEEEYAPGEGGPGAPFFASSAQARRYIWAGRGVRGDRPEGPASCAQPFFRLRFEVLVGALVPFEVAGPKVLGLLRNLGEVPLQAFLALESPDLETPDRVVSLLESALWSRHQAQLFESLAEGVRVRRTDLYPDGLGVAAMCGCPGRSQSQSLRGIWVEGTRRWALWP